MSSARPILAITMGDPSGIGPEIIAKAMTWPELHQLCCPVVVGDGGVMRRAIQLVGAKLAVRSIGSVIEAQYQPGLMDVLDLNNVDLAALPYGQVSAASGAAAFCAVKTAIELALAKHVAAVVTGPINKAALNLAGYAYSGHTEIFAQFTNTRDYAMMLAHGSMRVVHVSTHVSLRKACDRVRKDRIIQVIRLAHEACRRLGIENPRIGVAALNPHAGEGTLFGTEDQDEILPAVQETSREGLHAEGPVPADTLFPKLRGNWYDIAVAMYHDQGHIPLKLMGFNWNERAQKWDTVSGVNITLGLPIIRTSVDHGTAFDLAGKGVASESSMVSAIEYAARLASSPQENVQ